MIIYFFSGLSLIYLGLMIAAYPHVKEGRSITAIGPWWCFYTKKFNKEAHGFCFFGKVVFVIDLVALGFLFM